MCCLVFGASLFAAEETAPVKAAAVMPVTDEQVAALVKKLSSDAFALRESAMFDLAKLGDAAIPLLEKTQAGDPETEWRVAAAARMIKWKVSPSLWARTGDLIEEYEAADPVVRERIVRILRFSGDADVVPVLRQVLRRESDRDVRQAAAIMLADLGSDGLAVLLEEGVEISGLDPYDAAVHVLLGNSFLKDKNYKKAEEHYLKALEIGPEEFIAMYNLACIYSLQKKNDLAIQWLQKAVDAGYDDFPWMEKDEDLDNIRNDARYKEIVRKGPKVKELPEAPPAVAPDQPK